VAVYGVPGRPDPEQLGELLGRCGQLRAFARAHGFELEGSPQDLGPLDQAIDGACDQAASELGGPSQTAAALAEAGLFVGSVIVGTVAGAHWRLWPSRTARHLLVLVTGACHFDQTDRGTGRGPPRS